MKSAENKEHMLLRGWKRELYFVVADQKVSLKADKYLESDEYSMEL